MIYLRSLSRRECDALPDGYPFDIPLIQHLPAITFRSPVTFFVGENGTGKSTLLEAIAAGAGLPSAGADDVARDPSLGDARRLALHLRFEWARKNRRGFFLRAEDFLNYGRRMSQMIADLEAMAAQYEQELSGYGLALARGAVLKERTEIVRRYGRDLNARSHGESFLQFFQARFVPGGLYLLDEPDTALSPQRQLGLLAMLKEMVAQEAQFVVASHSPILMAFPEATIISFDASPPREVPYEQLEHVTLTRSFLAQPEIYLRHL